MSQSRNDQQSTGHLGREVKRADEPAALNFDFSGQVGASYNNDYNSPDLTPLDPQHPNSIGHLGRKVKKVDKAVPEHYKPAAQNFGASSFSSYNNEYNNLDPAPLDTQQEPVSSDHTYQEPVMDSLRPQLNSVPESSSVAWSNQQNIDFLTELPYFNVSLEMAIGTQFDQTVYQEENIMHDPVFQENVDPVSEPIHDQQINIYHSQEENHYQEQDHPQDQQQAKQHDSSESLSWSQPWCDCQEDNQYQEQDHSHHQQQGEQLFNKMGAFLCQDQASASGGASDVTPQIPPASPEHPNNAFPTPSLVTKPTKYHIGDESPTKKSKLTE